jgi:anti-anti-sigma regulatory factor
VVFSLFSRKERNEPRRAREALLARTADSRPGPTPDTLAAQREAARRTEEKINQIESEMIAAGAVPHAGAATPGPATMARALAPTVPQGAAQAAAQHAATSLLGDEADAMAIDVNGSSLPSVLEEAAILYSNGQPKPAELALRQALDDASLGAYRSLAWLMLLDLHQAQGDRPAFEALALDYAARFESSPPGWNEQLGGAAVAAQAASDGGAAVGFQARLDGTTAAKVDSILKASARRRETLVDFTRVEAVDAEAAEALLRLFRHFEKSPSSNTLAVRGAEPLFAATRDAIEPGRRDPSEAGWMLALQALRVLGRQQAFEDLSIEYCVTYEVSPPSWEPIGERIRAADGAGIGIEVPAAVPRPEPSAFALRGDVLGRMQAELQALRAHAANRGDVVVDCRGLRRMEFVAAGDLLNEVVTLHSAGKQVLFVEPNYLVYALMLVMGIQELAEIRRRRI